MGREATMSMWEKLEEADNIHPCGEARKQKRTRACTILPSFVLFSLGPWAYILLKYFLMKQPWCLCFSIRKETELQWQIAGEKKASHSGGYKLKQNKQKHPTKTTKKDRTVQGHEVQWQTDVPFNSSQDFSSRQPSEIINIYTDDLESSSTSLHEVQHIFKRQWSM